MSGWVKAHRAMADHPSMQGDARRWGMFLWLLWNAAWKDTETNINGQTVVIRRGEVSVSLRRFAKETGAGLQVVRTFLGRLETDTVINTRVTHGRTIVTICNYDKYQAAGDQANTAPNTGSNTGATHEQHIKEEGKKVRTSSNEEDTRETRLPSEPRGFSEFWAAYAHKKGIGAARKAYALALRKSDPARIIDGARVYAATRDPRFIKNASTWLNQECWEDDPATNQRKETPNGRRTPVGSADPGFADRLARWDELDARTAEASGHSGHPDFDADGADGWRSSNDRWSDRSGGFGTVVPLLQARGG